MSIASEIKRLQTAKENIKSAIEEKGVTVGDGTIDIYAEKISEISNNDGYDKGLEDGKQAEYDTFWDNYQYNGNRGNYVSAFNNKHWNDYTFKPKYPIIITDKGYDILTNAEITDTKVDMDYSLASNLRLLFSQCSKLITIRKLIVSEICVFDRTFNKCTALENITFEGKIAGNISFSDSAKLSTTSIQNIIDHLADLTGGTAQTLTLHATVGEKLTDEQKATITAKNWTLVY